MASTGEFPQLDKALGADGEERLADALALGRARQEIKPGRATLLRERALAIKAAKKAKA